MIQGVSRPGLRGEIRSLKMQKAMLFRSLLFALGWTDEDIERVVAERPDFSYDDALAIVRMNASELRSRGDCWLCRWRQRRNALKLR